MSKIDNVTPLSETDSINFVQSNYSGGALQTTDNGILRVHQNNAAPNIVSSFGHVSVGTPNNRIYTVPLTSAMFGSTSTLDGLTIILTIGGSSNTLTLSKATNAASQAAFITAVNSTFTVTSAANNSNCLVIPTASTLVIGAGTANTILGLTAGTVLGVTMAQLASDVAPLCTPLNNLTSGTSPVPVCREVFSAGGGTLTFSYPSQLAGGFTSTYVLPAGQMVALQAAKIQITASGAPTDLIVRF